MHGDPHFGSAPAPEDVSATAQLDGDAEDGRDDVLGASQPGDLPVTQHADAACLVDGPSDAEGAPGDALDLDVGVLDAIEAQLAEVELALVRLDDGSYGHCEACGAGIGDPELAAAPTARYCRDHLPLTLP